MATLLLRLAGPMQAWGSQSRFTVRDTGMEPTKSGVVGLLCAALGKPRAEQPNDGYPLLARLAALRMAVRVDREGVVRVDYQTAGGIHRPGDRYGVARADGSPGGTVTSRRYYVADASFLVGLEDEDEGLLNRLNAALARPVWALYLGRKACVPGVPVRLPDVPPLGPGLRQEGLEEALAGYPWPQDGASGRRGNRQGVLRLVLNSDTNDTTADVRLDVPVDFAARRYAPRRVITRFLQPPQGGM